MIPILLYGDIQWFLHMMFLKSSIYIFLDVPGMIFQLKNIKKKNNQLLGCWGSAIYGNPQTYGTYGSQCFGHGSTTKH